MMFPTAYVMAIERKDPAERTELGQCLWLEMAELPQCTEMIKRKTTGAFTQVRLNGKMVTSPPRCNHTRVWTKTTGLSVSERCGLSLLPIKLSEIAI